MQNNNNEQPTTPPAMQPQKRILALSVKGDSVWEISHPVLNWMIEHGDEELKQKAIATMIFWEKNQSWFIDWGNNTRYFEMAEMACRNLAHYKEAMKLIPSDNEAMQKIRELALMTGEQFNKPSGIGRKNILKQRRIQSRGKRR